MNGICPHCEGKEDPNHDCKRKSWAVLVVEEDDPDDESILMVFDGETKRKKVKPAKMEDFDDKNKKSDMFGVQSEKSGETLIEAGEILTE